MDDERAAYYSKRMPADVMIALVSSPAAAARAAGLGAEEDARRGREWGLTVPPRPGRNTSRYMLRHIAALSADALRSFCTEKRVERIEVGAVHTASAPRTICAALAGDMRISGYKRTLEPEDRARMSADTWKWRELVFDIDMNDYDGGVVVEHDAATGQTVQRPTLCVRDCACVRGDGSKKRVCRDCWPLTVIAARMTDAICRHQLGFADITWYFSGRRGVHGWIRDPHACRLNSAARQGLLTAVKALFTAKGAEGPEEREEEEGCGFVVEPAAALLRAMDEEVVPLFEGVIETTHGVLRRITEAQWRDAGVGVWRGSGAASWGGLDADERRRLVWRLAGPKLDEGVTTDVRHVIKVPFSLHPATGRVVEPLVLAEMLEFDPTGPNVWPRVEQRIEEARAQISDLPT